MVRSCERNIKRYRNSKMRQRWLAAVLLHCEQRFRRVKGYASIDVVVAARCNPTRGRIARPPEVTCVNLETTTSTHDSFN